MQVTSGYLDFTPEKGANDDTASGLCEGLPSGYDRKGNALPHSELKRNHT